MTSGSPNMIGVPRDASTDYCHLELQGSSNACHDLVLQCEPIALFFVEHLGPQMRAGPGVDQLGVDAEAVAGSLDAALEHEPDAQL